MPWCSACSLSPPLFLQVLKDSVRYKNELSDMSRMWVSGRARWLHGGDTTVGTPRGSLGRAGGLGGVLAWAVVSPGRSPAPRAGQTLTRGCCDLPGLGLPVAFGVPFPQNQTPAPYLMAKPGKTWLGRSNAALKPAEEEVKRS